jgi:serine/threonine-protein kinase
MYAPGMQIATHWIVRRLASGGDAEVFEVLTADGRRRALKVSKLEVAGAGKASARLGQEGEAIATIEHLNVLRFHDAGVEGDRVWLLLELVDGPDLRTLTQRAGGALPVARAVRLVRQASEGVAAAHAQDIVHRDLCPENILVAADDVVKVADFGAAKLEGWGVQTTRDQSPRRTRYAAPEYLRGQKAGPAADVYALALILYELIRGANPMEPVPSSAIQICSRQLTYLPPPLSSLDHDLPGDLSDLLALALSKDPALRPPMEAFAHALGVVQHRLDAPRRALARDLPLPNKDPALAKTEQFIPALAMRATLLMPVQFEPPSAPPPAARSVLLPPAPPVAPAARRQLPATLVDAAPTERSPQLPQRGSAWRADAGPERASTTAPQVWAPPRRSEAQARGGRGVLFAAVGALLLLGALGAGWAMLGPGAAPAVTRVSATGPIGAASLSSVAPLAPSIAASALAPSNSPSALPAKKAPLPLHPAK